ncbi:sortase A [Mycetocola sp. CAN_C7]|uniref:sortase domain-containing protein n=1 Tax=Mycetocola sp. CAN_C7 TaxID=2787724 RepID=UPI0018C9FBD1
MRRILMRAASALVLAATLALTAPLAAASVQLGPLPSTTDAVVTTANPTIIGTLRIPRFGGEYAEQIGEGIGESAVLNHMVGHFPGTAAPGGLGNFALAGHRVTYTAPLYNIHTLIIGDPIYVDTAEGRYLYRFRSLEYVDPSAIEVTYPVPHESVSTSLDRIITFVACSPMGSTAERVIAYGVFESFTPAD